MDIHKSMDNLRHIHKNMDIHSCTFIVYRYILQHVLVRISLLGYHCGYPNLHG